MKRPKRPDHFILGERRKRVDIPQLDIQAFRRSMVASFGHSFPDILAEGSPIPTPTLKERIKL